jgi:hypothetical protein
VSAWGKCALSFVAYVAICTGGHFNAYGDGGHVGGSVASWFALAAAVIALVLAVNYAVRALGDA